MSTKYSLAKIDMQPIKQVLECWKQQFDIKYYMI